MLSNKIIMLIYNLTDMLSNEEFLIKNNIFLNLNGNDFINDINFKKKITSLKNITCNILNTSELNSEVFNTESLNACNIEIYPEGDTLVIKEDGIIFMEINSSKVKIFRENNLLGYLKTKNIAAYSFTIDGIFYKDFLKSDSMTLPLKNNILSKKDIEKEEDLIKEKISYVNDKIFKISEYLNNTRELIIEKPSENISSAGMDYSVNKFKTVPFGLNINFLKNEKLKKILEDMDIVLESNNFFKIHNISSVLDISDNKYKISISYNKNSGTFNLIGSNDIYIVSYDSFNGGSNFKIKVSCSDCFGEIFYKELEFNINQGVILDIEAFIKYNSVDISQNFEINFNPYNGKSSELNFGFKSETDVDSYGLFFDRETLVSLALKKLKFDITIPKKVGTYVYYKDVELLGVDNGDNFTLFSFDFNEGVASQNLITSEIFVEGIIKKIELNNIFFSKNLANFPISLYGCIELEDGKKYEIRKNIKLITNTIDNLEIAVDSSTSSEVEFKLPINDSMTVVNEHPMSEFYDITLLNLDELKNNPEVKSITYKIYDGLDFKTTDATTYKIPSDPLVFVINKNESDNQWSYNPSQGDFYNGYAGVKYRVSKDNANRNIYILAEIETVYEDITPQVKKIVRILEPDLKLSHFLQGYNVDDSKKVVESYSSDVKTVRFEIFGNLTAFKKIKIELIGGSNWSGIEANFISFEAYIQNKRWVLGNFSSAAASNFVKIPEGFDSIFSELKVEFKKYDSSPIGSDTRINVLSESIFYSTEIANEFHHISSIINDDYYSIKALNLSKALNMPYVYEVYPIKDITSESIGVMNVLYRKRIFIDCGEDRSSNVSAIIYNKDMTEVSRALNEIPTAELNIDLREKFYLVLFHDGNESVNIKLKMINNSPEEFFFEKEFTVKNYSFSNANKSFYPPKIDVIDGNDLNRSLKMNFYDTNKFSYRTDVVLDVLCDSSLFASNIVITYSRDEAFMDFSLNESFVRDLNKKINPKKNLDILNMSKINKSYMSLNIKKVKFYPYQESKSDTNSGIIYDIIKKSFIDIFDPNPFELDTDINISIDTDVYDDSKIEILFK